MKPFHNRCRVLILFLFCSLILAALSPASYGAERYFPLDKLKPGMTGEGFTVFAGTRIEKFNVKVIDLLNQEIKQNQLILVRLSGKRLEECGGLAAGMSGSPVYIKGKLIGAISYGYENADPFLAWVTPIENMVQLWNSYQSGLSKLPVTTELVQRANRLKPVVTPIMISGMGRRGYSMLGERLERWGLKPVFTQAGQDQNTGNSERLKPGSAIAVQMVSGDYQVAAIGTVTTVNEQYFLAFGHPFMNKGNVDYMAYHAKILQVVNSPVMSFKIGTATNPIGRIVQDRQAGIMGLFGALPQTIAVTAKIEDLDRGLLHNSRFQVVNREAVYPDLIVTALTDTVDQALDRVGNGTARVTFRIELATKPRTIIRENIYYGTDIAVASLKELRDILNILATNELEPVEVKAVSVDIKIQNSHNTARIIKLEATKTQVTPGETVVLNAKLRTYRGGIVSIPFKVQLPTDIGVGKIVFSVRGGAISLVEEKEESSKESSHKLNYAEMGSVQQMVEEFLGKSKNNELVLEYYTLAEDQKEDAENMEEETKPAQFKENTAAYIMGDAQLTIEVIPVKR